MLRFVDSFGHYTTDAALLTKWGIGSGGFTLQATGGRTGGPCANALGSSSTSVGRLLSLGTGQTSWIMGAALQGQQQTVLQCNVYGSPFTSGNFPDGNNAGTLEWGMGGITLVINSAGNMTVSAQGYYNNGVWQDRASVASAAFEFQAAPLNPALWYYFEVKVVVNPSSNFQASVEVRVNGIVVYPLTSIDVSGAGYGCVWPNLHTFAPVLSGCWAVCDFVVLDNTGANNTSYLGDVRVVAQLPAGDGFHQDWAPLSGSSHFAQVDAASPPGDTDYNSTATVGNMDSYVFPTPPTSSQVFGVQVNVWSRKSDAGAREVEALARLSGTDEVSPQMSLSTVYGDQMAIFEIDPSGAAWTSLSLASAEFGVKLST